MSKSKASRPDRESAVVSSSSSVVSSPPQLVVSGAVSGRGSEPSHRPVQTAARDRDSTNSNNSDSRVSSRSISSSSGGVILVADLSRSRGAGIVDREVAADPLQASLEGADAITKQSSRRAVAMAGGEQHIRESFRADAAATEEEARLKKRNREIYEAWAEQVIEKYRRQQLNTATEEDHSSSIDK